MLKLSKVILGILIILIIGYVWYFMSSPKETVPMKETVTTTTATTTTPETPVVTKQVPIIQSVLTTNANDSSDTALADDLKNIDGQSASLSVDTQTIDQNITN